MASTISQRETAGAITDEITVVQSVEATEQQQSVKDAESSSREARNVEELELADGPDTAPKARSKLSLYSIIFILCVR